MIVIKKVTSKGYRMYMEYSTNATLTKVPKDIKVHSEWKFNKGEFHNDGVSFDEFEFRQLIFETYSKVYSLGNVIYYTDMGTTEFALLVKISIPSFKNLSRKLKIVYSKSIDDELI